MNTGIPLMISGSLWTTGFSFTTRPCSSGGGRASAGRPKMVSRTPTAGATRASRCDRWYELLREAIDLIAAPRARVIALGNAVAEHVRRRGFPREITPVIHYSPLAGRAQTARLR